MTLRRTTHQEPMRRLRAVRIVVSVSFFLCIAAMFVDITVLLPPTFNTFFTSLQILPALMRTLHTIGWAAMGLAVTVLATLLFGRVYCSSICPLGTYQDFIIRLSRRNRKRRWFRYHRTRFVIHYVLFVLIAAAVVLDSVLLLNALEPFSNFGRMVHTFVRPAVVAENNLVAAVAGPAGGGWLFAIPHRPFDAAVFISVLLFTGLVTYLAFMRGRIFCNLLCPAGALLALLSRLSLFRLVVNETSCTDCRLCEHMCKARCIDSRNRTIDFSACVGCFDCIEACHTNGVVYRPVWKLGWKGRETMPQEERRRFLRSLLPAAGALMPSLSTAFPASAKSGYEESRRHPVTPPGSISTEHFSANCTGCQLCIVRCPTQVLQPALFEYGIAGLMQPKMDFTVNYCTYDCIACIDACPSGALLPLTVEEKKLTQLGVSKFFKDDCIVIKKKKDCGACSEHCPTKAVAMVPSEGLMLPAVNESLCIGCGACEHACPTVPRKAIYVEPNPVHRRAEKPAVKELPRKESVPEAFPF